MAGKRRVAQVAGPPQHWIRSHVKGFHSGSIDRAPHRRANLPDCMA